MLCKNLLYLAGAALLGIARAELAIRTRVRRPTLRGAMKLRDDDHEVKCRNDGCQNMGFIPKKSRSSVCHECSKKAAPERDAAREERDEGLFAVAEAEAATRAVRASIPSWCLLVCALVVLVGLHLNYKYNLGVQERYADTVRTLQAHYLVWAATCFVEEGDAAERAQARAVPGV